MIENDQQLEAAKKAVENLQRFLMAARKAHGPTEYQAMAQPFLLELQVRNQEILAYLSQTEAELLAS